MPVQSPTRAPSQALLLVGHGSHLSPDSSAPVYAHAARLRERGAFDEVREVFWKEEPSLRDALDLVESEEIFVVPLFLAEGYFTHRVIPRELGLEGRVTRRGSRTIHYCPPVGTHPLMGRLILVRALQTCGLSPRERRDAALAIIGHGTERSSTSGDTVYRIVDELRALGEFGRVECGFLDEEPRIERVVEAIPERHIVLAPFFVAEGWHTRSTIPRDLGLTGDRTERGDRVLWYTPPVGTLPEVEQVILALARAAGARAEVPAHA